MMAKLGFVADEIKFSKTQAITIRMSTRRAYEMTKWLKHRIGREPKNRHLAMAVHDGI